MLWGNKHLNSIFKQSTYPEGRYLKSLIIVYFNVV